MTLSISPCSPISFTSCILKFLLNTKTLRMICPIDKLKYLSLCLVTLCALKSLPDIHIAKNI